MEETLLLIQKIKALINTKLFSKSDTLIAQYILDNPRCLVDATASSIAEATGTSAPTVVRFCRKLGYGGFADLKSNASDHAVISAEEMSLARGDSAGTVKNKVIGYSKMVMDQLAETLSDEALEEAARLLRTSRRVLIASEGGSGTIARAAYDILSKLAIDCSCAEDPIFQAMEINRLCSEDLLFVILNSGRTRNTVENAQHAKERGVKVLGIVGPTNSPLSKYLDVEIATSLFDSDYFSDLSAARISELVTVSILHSIIALAIPEEQLHRGQLIASAIERKRLPD